MAKPCLVHPVRPLQIIALLLLVPVVIALVLACDIYRYSFESDTTPADAAIVLGAAVWDTTPSPVFQERINHALDLLHSGTVRMIIFTGGQGRGEGIAESQAARAYALARGIPDERILCESTSTTTGENLAGAKMLMEQNGIKRVLIVSDPLHMKRAIAIAEDLHIDAHPSPTPTTRYISWQSQAAFLATETRLYATLLLRRLISRT